MHTRIGSRVVGGVAVAAMGAVAVAPVAAAAVEPGGIPLRIIRNQLQYCAVICPFAVQGAISLPVAVGTAPITLATALQSSASPLQALGAAAASVTAPARAATDGIITNDLTLVLPKAQNALQVSLVELINVGFATGQPNAVPQATDTARTNVAAALDQRVGEPVGPTGAVDLPQVLAVEAVNVGSAVLFQAPEAALLDVVATTDDVAQTLARTGNVEAAATVGAEGTVKTVNAATRTVAESINTAVRHVRTSPRDPAPTTTASTTNRTLEKSSPKKPLPRTHRAVDAVVHRVKTAVGATETGQSSRHRLHVAGRSASE